MQWLGEGIKYLPSRLQYLTLDLSENNFGENDTDVKYLEEGIKKLPKYLQYLQLDLQYNTLLKK